MRVRSSYQVYLDAVKKYFDVLLPKLVNYQHTKGGPIIAFQLENEYGSHGDDMVYMNFLKDTMRSHGITELLFTSDNGAGLQGPKLEGVLMTLNFQEKKDGHLMCEFVKNCKLQNGQPIMVMEFWTGWFDNWGGKHHTVSDQQFEETLNWILENGYSVNFYMFHGGTNFGFMAGANDSLSATNEVKNFYSADVTSYDYDSPVSESGKLTEKFFIIKKVLQQKNLIDVNREICQPQSIEYKAYDTINIEKYLLLNDILKLIEAINCKCPKMMEELVKLNNGGGQSFGYILYQFILKSERNEIELPGKVQDRAIILLNNKEVSTVEKNFTNYKLIVNKDPLIEENILQVLVENMGRVNYAGFNSQMLNQQKKGLKSIQINGVDLENMDVFAIELKKDLMNRLKTSDDWKVVLNDNCLENVGPCLYKANLNIIGKPKDTFIDTKNWTKGVIFVNGFNLGRYWNIGPQQTLYLPGPLLLEGNNEILIFELHRSSKSLPFLDHPELGEPILHKMDLPFLARVGTSVLRNVIKIGPWVWSAIKPFTK